MYIGIAVAITGIFISTEMQMGNFMSFLPLTLIFTQRKKSNFKFYKANISRKSFFAKSFANDNNKYALQINAAKQNLPYKPNKQFQL